MPAKLRFTVETQKQNARLSHYDRDRVYEPFEEPITIVERFQQQHASIAADPNLTSKGKNAARVKAATEALEAIGKWNTRLAGLDADIAVQRAALLPSSKEQPDGRQIDFILSHLRDKTPQEIAILYNSATDDRRLLMEAASASVGAVPLKTENGQEWKPLLDPETVNESVMARAIAKNPQGVAKLNELAEIRATHVTVAGHAVAEVREALSGVNLDA